MNSGFWPGSASTFPPVTPTPKQKNIAIKLTVSITQKMRDASDWQNVSQTNQRTTLTAAGRFMTSRPHATNFPRQSYRMFFSRAAVHAQPLDDFLGDFATIVHPRQLVLAAELPLRLHPVG